MDIALRKLELIEWLMHIRDEAKVEKLLAFKEELDGEITVAYNAVGEPLNSDQYRAEINEGLKDMEEGRTTSQDDFLNEIKSW